MVDKNNDKDKDVPSFAVKVGRAKTIPVCLFLLKPGHHGRIKKYGEFTVKECAEKDFLTGFVGASFQEKLKRLKRKEEVDKYKCKNCNGTGVLTAFDNASRKVFTKAIQDLLYMPAEKIAFQSINSLFGFNADADFQSELYTALSGMFGLAPKTIEEKKAENAETFKESEAPDKIAELGRTLKKSFGNFSDLASFIQPCGACFGSGYYDIGHVFDFGKQVDMMLYLYEKYIVNGTGDWKKRWNRRVYIKPLYERFLTLEVKPEIPNRIKNISSFTKAQAIAISKHKVNRDEIYMDIIKSVKTDLYDKYGKLYDDKDHSEDFLTPSFLEVYKFFVRVSDTARIATGTLKAELTDQVVHTLEHYHKFKVLYNTDSMADTPYPEAGFVVEGPAVGERLNVKPTGRAKSIMFVYGSMYVPNYFSGGKGKSNVVWGHGFTMHDLVNKSFSLSSVQYLAKNKNFIQFFPQRVK